MENKNMQQVENRMEYTPYIGIPVFKRLKMSLFEAPMGAVTLLERRRNREIISTDQAQLILCKAVDTLDGGLSDNLKTSPRIQSFLGQGFEATAFRFATKDGVWVMKIGLPKSCVPGLYSPSTDDYATMMKWNYEVLDKEVGSHLPYMLPRPYFVVSPSELGQPTTVQFLPYVEKIADFVCVTESQRMQLILERQKFYQVSRQMTAQYKVIPDLVGLGNLMLGYIENDPHYVLIDLGLFNLRAPAPILNLWVYLYQRIALTKDINFLQGKYKDKRSQSPKQQFIHSHSEEYKFNVR